MHCFSIKTLYLVGQPRVLLPEAHPRHVVGTSDRPTRGGPVGEERQLGFPRRASQDPRPTRDHPAGAWGPLSDLGFPSLPAGHSTIHVPIWETHSKSLFWDMQQGEGAGLGAAGNVHLHSPVYTELPLGNPAHEHTSCRRRRRRQVTP